MMISCRSFLVVLAECLLLGGAFAMEFSHTGKKAEKVWSVPSARSLEFEFRFPKGGKGNLRLERRGGRETGRATASFTILPGYCRPSVFFGATGKITAYPNRFWRDLGFYEGLPADQWLQARLRSSGNGSALFIRNGEIWHEGAFLPFSGETEELSMILDGTVEVRKFTVSDPVAEFPVHVLDVPEGGTAVVSFQTGRGGATLDLSFRDGTEKRLQFIPASDYASVPVKEKKKTLWRRREIPDAYFRTEGLNIKHFIRPDCRFYGSEKRAERIDGFLSLPGASERETELRFLPEDAGTSVWLDGRFAGVFSGRKLAKIMLRLPADGRRGTLAAGKAAGKPRFLTLETGKQNQVERAELKLQEKLPDFLKADGTFLRIARHKEFTRPQQELDAYLSRSAFSGMPESFLYSVPSRQYWKAHILAALDPDPAKSPILTARLTRYRLGGVGDAVADASIDLSKAPRRIVGKAAVGGKPLDVALYEVRLPVGEIQDYLFVKKGKLGSLGTPYLDFELLGPLGKAGILWDFSRKPGAEKSGALVFGVALEAAPAEMELEQSVPGLIFADADPRRTPVRVTAAEEGKYQVKALIGSVDGKTIRENSFALELKAGETVRKELDLRMPSEGHYDLALSLLDSRGRELVLHRASFAELGKDTREAGLESPYSGWWFGPHHNGTADPAVAGPMLKKAGIRRITAAFLNTDERRLAPWKLTLTQIPWFHDIIRKRIPLAEKIRLYEAEVRKTTAAYPSCKSALIFHESYGGPVPPRLYGGTAQPLPARNRAALEKLFETGCAVARMFREKFPQIRLVMGNSASSTAIADAMLGMKFPKELFDFLGSEAVGRFCLPELFLESGGPHGAWFLREIGRMHGYPQPVEACYEWVGHIDRELTRGERAAWCVRDALLAHAYGFGNVPLGTLYDVEDSYFNTQWGGGAMCRRYPLLYPKPVYVAAAAMTKVLDKARFVRRVPTGSLTVYAMEFAGEGGRFVYPLWLPRGSAELSVEFDGDPRAEITGFYGARETVRRTGAGVSVRISEFPLYLSSVRKVKTIRIVRRETPPRVTPEKLQSVDPLRSVANVLLMEGMDGRLASPWRTPGRFVLRDSRDCLELELLPSPPGKKIPPTVAEYVNIAFRRPVPLKGKPSSLGIEVFGNSSWARIFFVLIDSRGQTFISSGEGYGSDGRALSYVNFDGWGTIQFPFTSASRVRLSEVNASGGVWKADGDGIPVYPVSVAGLAVAMPRHAADLNRLVSVADCKIRLRNFVAFE